MALMIQYTMEIDHVALDENTAVQHKVVPNE